MTAPLLQTKLYLPPLRPQLVPRARLRARLDAGLRQGHRLTLVCAPAGFGKTTLITAWLYETDREIAWLSLDEDDADPIRLLTYLIAALQQVDGRIGRALQPLLQAPQPPPLPGLVTLLINDLAATPALFCLVLDDLHLLHGESVETVLRFLVENLPPNAHLVVATREEPPLPLARWRARGQLTELRASDLRFTPEEAAAFLQQTMGLTLSPEACAALAARTEGWIAGLQLAALALQEQPASAEAALTTGGEDTRYVMDYLLTEVLQRQPEHLREFMLQIALLDRFTPALCDAVTGRNDSAALLAQLESVQAFLVPLDRQRQWSRYHRLFAEALQARLAPDRQAVLHQRAARWYEMQGLLPEAIHHALAGAALTGVTADAERLIATAAAPTLFSGGLLTLRAWLAALPAACLWANSELAAYQGWIMALTGDTAAAEAALAAAEACYDPATAPPATRGTHLTLRGFIALLTYRDYETALAVTQEALHLLDARYPHWRVIALWILAEARERTRPITEAIAAFREARETGRTSANQIFAATVEMSLAMALNANGQRSAAVALCEETLARYTDDAGVVSPLASLILSRLGLLHYEANQLALARESHARAIAASERLPLGTDLSFARGMAANTFYALGETKTALTALQEAAHNAAQSGYTDDSWCRAWETNIHLQQGDITFAERWAQRAGLSPEDSPSYLQLDAQLTYARLLIAQRRLAEAQRRLTQLDTFYAERALHRWRITAQVLLALTALHRKDAAGIHAHLAQAVELAAPESYFRAFLDEDPALLKHLPDVQTLAPAFVEQLLRYARIPTPKQTLAVEQLIEPLSDRELEVLQLLAAGQSNQEIAQTLFIAPGTVKQHLKAIFGKLQVHNRTEAARRAQELGLL